MVGRTLTSLKRRAQEVLGGRNPGSTVLVPRDHETHCVSLRAEVGIALSCVRIRSLFQVASIDPEDPAEY